MHIITSIKTSFKVNHLPISTNRQRVSRVPKVYHPRGYQQPCELCLEQISSESHICHIEFGILPGGSCAVLYTFTVLIYTEKDIFDLIF